MTAGCAARQQGVACPENEANAPKTGSRVNRRRRGRCSNVIATNNYIARSDNSVADSSPVYMDTDSGCEQEDNQSQCNECAEGAVAKCNEVAQGISAAPALDNGQVSDADLVRGVGLALTSMAALAEGKPIQRTAFHSIRVPGVSIHEYLNRIFRFFHCSPECYILALIYIDRLIKRAPGIVVCRQNCHRLLISAMVLAAKNHDDTYYSNAFYAKVGGVQVSELNNLELRFLQTLSWKVHVTTEEYALYYRMVCSASR